MSAAQLLEDVRAGNHAALDALIQPCLQPLKRFATRHLPARVAATTSADDLVQDAVLKVIGHLDHFEFRHEDSLLAYLRTSVRHRIVDQWRKEARRQPSPLSTDLVDPAPSPLERMISEENVRRYLAAKSRLHKRDRQLIALRIEQQLSYVEVASRLHFVTPDAARVALTRAIGRLRRALEGPSSS